MGPLILLFYGIWITYGFMLWLDTDERDTKSSVILSWCIIHFAFTVIGPCCVFMVDFRFINYCNCGEYQIRKIGDCIGFAILFAAIFGIKDIVILWIAFSYDCNQAVNGNDPFVIGSMDVNSWMLVGGFTHLMMVSIWSLMCPRWYGAIALDAYDASDIDDKAFCCYYYALLFFFLFSLLWVVLGFVTWSQMDVSHVCSQIVLSWSIIESVFNCCVYCASGFVGFFISVGSTVNSITK